MNTKMIITGTEGLTKEDFNSIRDIFKGGGLVAFPTETVYGLGADALNKDASEKIYSAKGRPSDNPLIVHIAKFEDLYAITKEVPDIALQMAKAFWPGPLTMIFRKNEKVPYSTTGGLDTVAVRMPDHKTALAVIEAAGGYVAAPSANTSGRPSPTLAKHVYEDMNGKIDAIIDGGEVGIGLESTILDLTGEIPMILRPGYITKKMIEAVIGPIAIDRAITDAADFKGKPKAPGMKYKHYAPKASLVIVEGNKEAVADRINLLTMEKQALGFGTGIICAEETQSLYGNGIIKCIGTRNKEETIARNLYAVLREFDELKVDYIYSESFYTPNMGNAIMNRLLKAAGHQVITVE